MCQKNVFPQLRIQYMERGGDKIYLSVSEEGLIKPVSFEVLCKMIDAKNAIWRLPLVAYIIRGNVILSFLVY